MRMRKKKHGAERIEACSEFFVKTRDELSLFPIELEIGCGKGSFICEKAKRNPDINYVAIEKISDVILFAAEKLKKEAITNVKLMRCDAGMLGDFFKMGDISKIYLNFSDPWPKKGYYKRRLTYKGFLDIYKQILTEDGVIELKTDNEAFFDFSLEQFAESGFKIKHITRDLHNSQFAHDNIITEYENNFSEKGFNINYAVAYL